MSKQQDSEDLSGYHAGQRANAAENRLREVRSGGPPVLPSTTAVRGTSWVVWLLIAVVLVGLGWLLRGLVA